MTSGFIAKVALARFALAVGIAVPHLLAAQEAASRKPIELGFDAALTRDASDQAKQTSLTVPVPRIRVGFFLTDALSLEPSVRFEFSRSTFENTLTGNDVTSSRKFYDADLGLLYHLSTDRTRSQIYLRPFVGIRGFTGDGDSDSQTSFGGGLGLKLPAADRLGLRLEVGYARFAEDVPTFGATDQLFASFGLSFFTR
jgi:Outer membrane protein beta-barrel domain